MSSARKFNYVFIEFDLMLRTNSIDRLLCCLITRTAILLDRERADYLWNCRNGHPSLQLWIDHPNTASSKQ